MKKFILIALGLMLSCSMFLAHAETSPVVIQDDFTGGWGSWSWPASPQPVSVATSPVFKGSGSIRMNFNAAWAGFSPGANSGVFDTTGYTALVFAVYNASNAGQLYLRATDSRGVQTEPSIYLQDYTTQNLIASNQWTWIRIPIADLKLGVNPQIAYFAIQSAGVGVAYFDEMRFEANTTLYEGVRQQGGPTVQRYNWGSTVTQVPGIADQADYWLEIDIGSSWGGVQFHEVMKYSGALPSSSYGMLTVLFQKTSTSQQIIASLVEEGNITHGNVNLENYTPIGVATLNTWYRALIPFSDFGLTGVINLDGVLFSGSEPGVFKIDDLKFVENFRFPLSGKTGKTASVTSAMDHSMTDAFCGDGLVVAYNEETGKQIYGQSSWNFVSPNGPCMGAVLRGYQKSDGSPFDLEGKYVPTSDGINFLFYDGHPGIDYRAVSGTQVLATASGRIAYSDCSGGSCSSFGVIKIDHGYGLVTSYNHMSSLAFGLSVGSNVRKGQIIGTSGHTGISVDAEHLHLSVLWGISSPKYIDPYGWKGSRPDPYTNAKNVCLWEGGC